MWPFQSIVTRIVRVGGSLTVEIFRYVNFLAGTFPYLIDKDIDVQQ